MFGVIFSSSSRPFLPAWLCHSCSWYYNSLTCLSQLYRLALLFSVFGLLEWADLHYFFLWMDDKKSVNFSSSLSTDIFYIIFSITFRNVIRLKCYIGLFAFLLPGLGFSFRRHSSWIYYLGRYLFLRALWNLSFWLQICFFLCQSRIENPVEHLRWNFFCKNISDFSH